MISFRTLLVLGITLHHSSRVVSGQGLNIKIPLPIVDDILNSDSDKDHEDRWWFWVIIGIIGAFFIVGIYFTIRGFLRYRSLQNQEESVHQHYGQMGRKISMDYSLEMHETGEVDSGINSRDLIQRCGIAGPGNALGAMVPVHASAHLDTTQLREQMVMQKINPRFST